MRLLLAAALALPLLGCVPRQEGGHERILYSFWGSTEQQAAERAMVAAFEAANPDVKVDMLPIGVKYGEKLQTMLFGETAPDVITVELGLYHDWAARNQLACVDDLMAAEGRRERLMPVPRAAFERDGHFYAVPVNCSGQVMFANLDALAKAGIGLADLDTWEKLAALAPRLSRRTGAAVPTEFASFTPSTATVIWSFGGALFDDPHRPRRVTADGPRVLEALRFMRRLCSDPAIVPPDVMNDQGTFQLFRDGKCALYFGGRWMTPEFQGRTAFAWDIAPLPAGPAGAAAMHGGTALAIWKGSLHAAAARRFVAFYTSREGTLASMRAGRMTPVYRDLAFGPDFLAQHPPRSTRAFSDTMEAGHSRALLYAAGLAEVTQIFQSRVEQLASQPDISVEAIAAGLRADLERWLARRQRKGEL